MDELRFGQKVRHREYGLVGWVERIDGPYVQVAFDYPEGNEGPRGVARRVKVNKYIFWEKFEAVEEGG